jgi:hypothetical protein
MSAKQVFRVKTMFHLLQAIILVDKNQRNILYLDGDSVNGLKESLEGVFFQKVYVNKYSFRKSKLIRFFFTFLLSVVYRFRFFKIRKRNYIFISSSHNIVGSVFKYFFGAKKIKILEDGNYSYNMYCLDKLNFLYENQIQTAKFKYFLGNYFFNVNNLNISNYYFTSRDRLEKNLPVIYQTIEERIIQIDLIEEIKNMSELKKKWIKSIFFNGFSLDDLYQKSIVLITQPIDENGLMSKNDLLVLYDKSLKDLDLANYKCFIKLHPIESSNKYLSLINKYSLNVIPKDFPFELLELFSVKFDFGITYNSTAVFSDLIKNKIVLDKTQLNLFGL